MDCEKCTPPHPVRDGFRCSGPRPPEGEGWDPPPFCVETIPQPSPGAGLLRANITNAAGVVVIPRKPFPVALRMVDVLNRDHAAGASYALRAAARVPPPAPTRREDTLRREATARRMQARVGETRRLRENPSGLTAAEGRAAIAAQRAAMTLPPADYLRCAVEIPTPWGGGGTVPCCRQLPCPDHPT